MGVTNVKTEWVSGNLYFYDKDGNEIFRIDGTNRKFYLPSGSTLEAQGSVTIVDKALEAGDLALTTGSIFIGSSGKASALDMKADGAILIGNGTTAEAKTTSGDAKIANDGSITIQAKAVENTMIAAAVGTVLVGTKTSGDVTALTNSAEGAIVIGQGATETCASAVLSGDVKMDKTGATTIQAKAVENTMIAAAAGTVLVGTKTSGDVTALDISAEGAMAIGQGAGETAVAHAMSGDVTMTKGGVTAIGGGKVLTAMIADANVTNAKLANGAGLGAVVTAGLGNSVSYTKATDGAQVILADNATKDRGVLVVAVIDETFADAGGNQTVIEIGEEATIDKCFDHTVFVGATAGTIFCKGFLNSSGKDIIATVTKAVGAGTGGASFAVLALPNS